MKSKIKLILAFVLSALMLFVFAGCATKADDDGAGELICDFEQWMPDFSGTHISDTFGRITLNTDTNFVAHGSGSAKIEPEGGGWMYVQTASKFFDYDHSDFTHVSGVQAKVYNATNDTMEMTMGFVTKVNLYDSFDRVGDTTYKLAPGWNTVTLVLHPEIMCYMTDVKKVEGVSFTFPSGVDSEDKQAVFYLDDIRLIKKDEANTSTDDQFPYAFSTYSVESKLVAFEDEYSDNFFIHEKEKEMAVVNVLSERNGQGEIIGLPDENKPKDEWVFKIKVDTEDGWTPSGGLNGKLLRDVLSKFDASVLNAQGARIVYRIYATSDYAESYVNCMLANLRFRTARSYADFYTRAGEYFLFNEWYEYEIPLADIVNDSSFSEQKTAAELATALDNVTLYTASYHQSGTSHSSAIAPYTLYLSDLYIKVPEHYESVKGKLINFQDDNVLQYIRADKASEVSLVDSTTEEDAKGTLIGAPFGEGDNPRKVDKQVLKVEIPEGVGDWEDTITVFPDLVRYGLSEFGYGELDKNSKITFKMYVTGDTIDQAYGDLRAWYNTTAGQISTIQTKFSANTGWQTFQVPLSVIMDNSNFSLSLVNEIPNKLKRFTFRGPVQTTEYRENPKKDNKMEYMSDNHQVARTMYISDFYIDPVPTLANTGYQVKKGILVDFEQDAVRNWINVTGGTKSADIVKIAEEDAIKDIALTGEFANDTRVLKLRFTWPTDWRDTQNLFGTALLQAGLKAIDGDLSDYKIQFKALRLGGDENVTGNELTVNISNTAGTWTRGNNVHYATKGSKVGEWKDYSINIGASSEEWVDATDKTTILGGKAGAPPTGTTDAEKKKYNIAFGGISASQLADNFGGIGIFFMNKVKDTNDTTTEQTLYITSIKLVKVRNL